MGNDRKVRIIIMFQVYSFSSRLQVAAKFIV